jgi:hypothetical protein
MTPSAWFVLLTDTEDDPTLVNMAHVTHVEVHVTGATLLSFVTREAVLVHEPVETLAELIAAARVPRAGEEAG